MSGRLAVYTRPPAPRPERLARDLAELTVYRAARRGGPWAVASSLRRGLRAVGHPAVWNPRVPDRGAPVAVLSDVVALRAAIGWRREGRVRRLIAGPNLVVSPFEHDSIALSPEIDVYVVPSQWPIALWREWAGEIADRMAVWPAGVDTARLQPPRQRPGRHAVLYRKDLPMHPAAPAALVAGTARALRDAGWTVEEISYGGHTRRAWLGAVRRSSLAVFFTPLESQGLAMFEAWALDVPTLVWDAPPVVDGRPWPSHPSPYLSEATGARFGSVDDVRAALAALGGFTPRAWVAEHATDALSAQAFLRLL